MSELERLARAFADAAGLDWGRYDRECTTGVRAILRELREPTGGMIGAGNAAGCKSTWRTVTTDVWQAIIDHILSEGNT